METILVMFAHYYQHEAPAISWNIDMAFHSSRLLRL